MIKRIRESLILKWMVFSILLATIPLIIVGFGIVQIYHEDLRRSLITVEGIALAVGILLSLLLTRKLILPIKRLSKEMEEELVQRTRELEALNEMGTLINQTLVDLDTIFPIALEKAMSLTGFEMGSIFMLNEERNILERKFHKGFPPKMLEDGEVLKYGEGVSGRAVILKQPIINSINEYSSFRVSPVLIEGGIQTLVGFPLLAKGKAIGTITLFSRSPHDFTQREVNLLESIGNQIGLALENAKLFTDVAKAKSEWETTFDAVTDLITIRDKDYRILRANKAAFKRFGLEPEEMIGKRCFETLHQSNQPCEGCYVYKTLETKKPESGERDSKYLKGIFQYYTFPIYDEAGEVIAVVDLAREITEEKRLEIEKEVVNNVNKILASGLDIKQMIQAVHSELKRVLDSERMSVAVFNEEGEGFRYLTLDYNAKELLEGVIYPKKGTPFEKAIETGLPVIVSDTAESDSWIDQKVVKEGILSVLVFPLEYKGRIIGAMNFGSKESNHFSDHHIRFLHSIASGLTISIQNTLLFEEVKKRLDELTILYEITKIATSSLNLDLMLREIINSLNSFFKFEALGILLIEENTKILVPHRASYNDLSISDIGKLGLCVGKGITGWVAEKGEPLLVDDVREDDRYICGDENIRSEMCVPLKVGQKVIGVIDAQSKELNAFSENDLRLLNIAAGQISKIIENIHLQEEIKQSEEKYRTVVEAALDGICIIGKDYQIKYVNEKLVEIQGYSKEEQIGRDLRSFLAEESKALLADREAQRKKGVKSSPYFELTILRKGGGIRHVEASARNIKDSKGNVNTIAILKDITDRKQAEEALRQSEEEARRLAQENAIMAKIGRIISSTLNIEEVYERFAEEARKLIPFDRIAISLTDLKNNTSTTAYLAGIGVLGRGPGDIIPMAGTVAEEVTRTRSSLLIQGDNINEVASQFPALLPTFQAGLRSMIFVPLMSKDQVIGVLSLRSLVPKAYTDQDVRLAESIGDQIAGAIANAQLFTGRKLAEKALRQSEEKYRAILENMQEGYLEVDLAGNFTFVNNAQCRNLGYTREELMGMSYRRYTDEKNARELYQTFNGVYGTGEPVKVLDVEVIRKDGTKGFNEISVSLIRDSEGKPMGFRGISRDITEKKRMEKQLFQSEKLRAVGEMASGVAHDFNNALAAILGNTQLLLYTTKDEELKGSLKVIEKVAWDSAQTVRRLQDFTRKSVHQELFKVDVNSIIKDSIEITKPKWKDEVQSRGIHIEMVSNFEEIPTVIGSTSELREVITNMIFNAIEAMPEGGKIEIRTFQRKSNVFIQISDSGIGMTEEVKKKAFEPFFTTKPFSNTGLGLSMSYGVIKRFGGEIEVESKVGHGTTFTIILPIGLEGKEEVDVSPIIKKGREARILVIDDEETVRSVLSQILSQVNHQVTVAENGEEGIRLFREKDFDLVLTDLGMPGMSGWEVCRAIKKMSSHIPVGMITGWGVEVDQSKIEENGIDFVIPKPFQFDQILKVVDETIASRRSHL